MQSLSIILALVALVIAIVSIINIIYPIKAIGFANRKRAASVFLLSLLLFTTAVIMARVSQSDTPRDDSWMLLIFCVILAYLLFRIVRRGRKKGEDSVQQSIPTTSDPHHDRRVPRQRKSEWGRRSTESGHTADRTIRQNRTARTRVVRWIQPGDTATVAGRKIGGMIYLGPEPPHEGRKREGGGSIDSGLPVARVGSDFSGESMPYWPSYRQINPQSRATYLDWLAGGRSDKRIGPGYVFLYFYGLERRFFVDVPTDEERHLLVVEAERLLGVYGENHSVQRYLGAFLDAARIVLGPTGDPEPRFEKSSYELPLGLRVAIGRMAKMGQPLSAKWLLGWYIVHPDIRLRTPATRAFPEFKALFALLFDERFPDGLKMRTPKRLLRARYAAASGAFDLDLKRFLGDIPDIAGTSRSLSIAEEIAEEATGALEKYSRFLGRNPDGRDTIEAHALLPKRLWPLFPCAEMEDLRRWAEKIIDKGGLSPVEQVVERLEGAPPEKIGKRQLTGVADALARLSIGMAPDPRFALRSPKLGEPVVLFRLPEGITALEEVSAKYKDILVAIAMGSFVAHADGTIAAKGAYRAGSAGRRRGLVRGRTRAPPCEPAVDAGDPARSGPVSASSEGCSATRPL